MVEKGIKFKIPLYQRLFTWNNEKIKTLLEDMYFHFRYQKRSRKIKPYYLGIITQIPEENGAYTLVIDGQQRITALMLLGAVFAAKNYPSREGWKKFLCPANNYIDIEPDSNSASTQETCNGNNIWPLRMLPYARDNDQQALKTLIKKKRECPDEILKDDETSNTLMVEGIQEIDTFLADQNRFNEYAKDEFINDIYENLTLLVSSLDPSYLRQPAYLNKYFEIMNSNYKNLASHEALKICLYNSSKKVGPDTDTYLDLWNKCEDMSEPLGKLVKTSEELKKEDEAQNQIWENEYYTYYNKICERLNSSRGEPLKHRKLYEIEPEPAPQRAFVGKGSRSIINFPEFLLLALDIFLERNLRQHDAAPQATSPEQGITPELPESEDKITQFYNTGNLLKTFGYPRNPRLQPADIPHFFKFLLKLRALLDFYVIRRAEVTHDEYSIQCCKINGKSSRDEGWTPEKTECRLIQYQAMLRITFQDKYYYKWLKPYLSHLYTHHFPNNEDSIDKSSNSLSPEHLLNWLKNWDNQRVSNKMTLYINNVLIKPENFTYASRNRYSFLRLDYYLWENSADPTFSKKFFKDDQLNAVKAYRMRRNRSIEHVSPQNPDGDTLPWDPKDLHSFGNLAMISNSLNSVQSNNTPHVKFARLDDQINNGRLESLKLLVMKNKEAAGKWNPNMADEHGTEMREILKASFGQICTQPDTDHQKPI